MSNSASAAGPILLPSSFAAGTAGRNAAGNDSSSNADGKNPVSE